MADIIDDLIEREGGDKLVNNPSDKGGLTKYGISEKSNPGVDVSHLSYQEARNIYEAKYVKVPGFHQIHDPVLREQLVDFGVNSGPSVAISKLQKVVGVKEDGILGPATLVALDGLPDKTVSNLLVGERVRMIGRIVQKNPSQLKFLVGWLNRATEFLK